MVKRLRGLRNFVKQVPKQKKRSKMSTRKKASQYNISLTFDELDSGLLIFSQGTGSS